MRRTPPDFKKIFENIPGLFIILRPDFTIAAVSDNYLKIANKTRVQTVDLQFFEVFPQSAENIGPAIFNALKVSFEAVLRTRKSQAMSARRYETANDSRYLGSVNFPLFDEKGEVEYIVRHVEDITALMRKEDQRLTLEHERDLFFDRSFDLMAVVGTDGNFKRVNPSFGRILGYAEDELLGHNVSEFLHPEDLTKTKTRINELAKGEEKIESINRYRSKDGVYRWFSWNTSPMDDLLYTVGRDVTEQIRTEEKIRSELRGSEAQVQQLQKMDAIGRLAGGIAHDFNNMLGAVSMYCDLLFDDAENPQAVRAKVQDLRNVTSRAAALTRQLLVFSRKQVVAPKTIALNSVIQQLEKMLVRLISENIRFVTHLAPDLKSVSIDPTQVEQVLLNLVVNAKDALTNGGMITVETSNVFLDEQFTSTHLSVTRGHYVQLTVSDNGFGMSSETVEKIFEPFFTTKEVGKGTGLGLTTTYGIIKQAKGTIWVYSELGKGTVFKIYLPVSDKEAEVVEMPQANAGPEATGHETILLVEDDELLREGFSEMLERRGFKVLVAASGKEALEISQSYTEEIHLLLSDMIMPGLTGIELAKRVVIARKNIKVLYMSGYTSDALENSGIDNLSSAQFIQKPFDTRALVAKVQEILGVK